MAGKDKVYYYSYELFKSIMLQARFQSKFLTEVTNSLLKEGYPDGVVNMGISATKLCNILEKKINTIKSARAERYKVKEDKIALTDTEVEDIRVITEQIEEYEFLLSGCGLSVMFH